MKRLEDIDLNLLLLLHWLLEDGSVTQAASRIGISQPAASRGLQRLREVFSDELLIRSGRSYTCSKLANAIRGDLAQAVQHLRTVAHMEEAFDPAISQDKVVIACNDYLSKISTRAWIKAITPFAPRVKSSWRPLDISVKDALASGQIDLALIPRVAQATIPKSALLQDMVVRPLLEDRFVVFGANSHPALKAEPLSLEVFAAAEHVLVSPQGDGPGVVDKVLSRHGIQRRIAHRTFSFSHAADIAITTGSLTVIPERLAKIERNGAFRSLPFETGTLSSDIVWHASRTSDKAHTWVRHQLQLFFKT